MSRNMRQRLLDIAERTADYGVFNDEHVGNWPEVIDAILAEMRKPDEAMLDAADEGREPAADMGLVRHDTATEFTAMIDAVREGR